MRGSNICTILQVKTGVQPHPVTLQSSCSDLVPYGQDGSLGPGSGGGGACAFRSPSGVMSSRGAEGLGVGSIEVRHFVEAQKPKEGFSSHSLHGSEEPGLRLRSRAAMLPWKRRVPLSLTAGITVIGGWGGRRMFPWQHQGLGLGGQSLLPLLPPFPSSPHPTVEASSQQEV